MKITHHCLAVLSFTKGCFMSSQGCDPFEGSHPSNSIRAGDIVGEHTVMFISNGERLELTHRATSRNAFASGVIKAIRFIAKQKPGLYGMGELLKF